MMTLKQVVLIGKLCLLLIISGCASNSLYRTRFEPCTVSTANTCSQHSLQQHNAGKQDQYLLGFVEINDQGQLRNRQQMQALIDTINETAADDGVLINVFVHGWHHNAAPGDRNIDSFNASLTRLSQMENELSLSSRRSARKIIGVYVGWRGESITLPVINNLTFWERKNTAQEVGYLGIIELLVKLEEVTRVKNALTPKPKSRLVVVGHSFGGAVVFSATMQMLANRFVDSQAGKTFQANANGFGDLVVLLNPAFEAIRYAPLYDIAQSRCSYFANQLPKLAILTSEADYATKLAFPAGRFFSTLFETHDTVERSDCNRPFRYKEGAADRTAAGHFQPFITHTLTPASTPEEKAMPSLSYGNMKTIWRDQDKGQTTRFGSTLLTHLGKTDALNPYLNIRVDKALIPNHNDVFGDPILEFLRLLIALSASNE